MSILLYERFAPPLVRRHLDDRQTVELAAVFLRVRVLATPLMFVSFFTAYLFQTLSKGENIHDAGRGALAGIQLPHAVHTQRRCWHVRPVWSHACADALSAVMFLLVYLKFRPPMLRA